LLAWSRGRAPFDAGMCSAGGWTHDAHSLCFLVYVCICALFLLVAQPCTLTLCALVLATPVACALLPRVSALVTASPTPASRCADSSAARAARRCLSLRRSSSRGVAKRGTSVQRSGTWSGGRCAVRRACGQCAVLHALSRVQMLHQSKENHVDRSN
jgi:hypothetical protein